MTRKGEISGYMYVAFVVMLGIIGIVFVVSRMTPVQSPEARSLQLASSIALYIDSLSTVEQGSVRLLDARGYKYDIAIQRYGSAWVRDVVRSKWFLQGILAYFVHEGGFFVEVMPYVEKMKEGKKTFERGDTYYYPVSVFDADGECTKYNLDPGKCSRKFEEVSGICITKSKDKEYPEVKACAE